MRERCGIGGVGDLTDALCAETTLGGGGLTGMGDATCDCCGRGGGAGTRDAGGGLTEATLPFGTPGPGAELGVDAGLG